MKAYMEKYKPFINDLIQYYYTSVPDFGCGGSLHVVLDDGNIEHSNIRWCKEECEKDNDALGMLIADILLEFTEKELEEMYDKDFWGIQ